jgi:hypothetical protein
LSSHANSQLACKFRELLEPKTQKYQPNLEEELEWNLLIYVVYGIQEHYSLSFCIQATRFNRNVPIFAILV